MGIFTSNSDAPNPEIRQVEKVIAKESKADRRTLDHAIKDLDKTQKAYAKGSKAAEKAQQDVDSAVKKQFAAAKALNNAQQQVDDAVANEQTATKNLELQKEHVVRLEQDVQQRKSSLSEVENRKQANDYEREMKISQMHARAANGVSPVSTISSHDNTVSNNNDPVYDKANERIAEPNDGKPDNDVNNDVVV